MVRSLKLRRGRRGRAFPSGRLPAASERLRTDLPVATTANTMSPTPSGQLQPMNAIRPMDEEPRNRVRVLAIEDDGCGRRQHHAATQGGPNSPGLQERKEGCCAELERTRHEMEPPRVAPTDVFVDDELRAKQIAQAIEDEERCQKPDKNRPQGELRHTVRTSPDTYRAVHGSVLLRVL